MARAAAKEMSCSTISTPPSPPPSNFADLELASSDLHSLYFIYLHSCSRLPKRGKLAAGGGFHLQLSLFPPCPSLCLPNGRSDKPPCVPLPQEAVTHIQIQDGMLNDRSPTWS
jgi:hypothetical protein